MKMSNTPVVGKFMKREEFNASKDKILEFYKEHNKLNIFYCGEDFIGWSLGLEKGFDEDDYGRIFEWDNSVIVGIEYDGDSIREINRIATELEELFGISAEEMGFYHPYYRS